MRSRAAVVRTVTAELPGAVLAPCRVVGRLMRASGVVAADPGHAGGADLVGGIQVPQPDVLLLDGHCQPSRRFRSGRPTGVKVWKKCHSSTKPRQSRPVYCGPLSVLRSTVGHLVQVAERRDECLADRDEHRRAVLVLGERRAEELRQPESMVSAMATVPSSRVQTLLRSVTRRRVGPGAASARGTGSPGCGRGPGRAMSAAGGRPRSHRTVLTVSLAVTDGAPGPCASVGSGPSPRPSAARRCRRGRDWKESSGCR